jgi:hypothetical protein
MVKRRNAFRLPRYNGVELPDEIRHIEPKDPNSFGLSHSVATSDGLVFYTRVPVWTYKIYIRIILKVQAFATSANLKNEHSRRGSKYANTVASTHSSVDDGNIILILDAATAEQHITHL